MPGGGARGQNLEHLRFFFASFSCMELFVFEQQVLLTLSVTSNLRIKCPGVGQGVKI